MSDASEYKLYTEAYVNDIAEALKEKYTKPTDPETYTIRQMANAVRGLAIPNPDWTEIGYNDTPKGVIDDFSYSKKIYDEWDPTIADRGGSIAGFAGNRDLRWFPAVDMSNVTSAVGMFKGCPNLEGLYEHQTFPALVNGYELVAQPVAGSRWNCNIDWDMPNCTTLYRAFMSLGGRPLVGSTQYEYSLRISIRLNIPKIQSLDGLCYMQGGELTPTLIGDVELTTGPDLVTVREAFLGNTALTSVSISDTSGVGRTDSNGWWHTFEGCTNLENLSVLNMQYAPQLDRLFFGCSKLRAVRTTSTIGSSIGVSRCQGLFGGCTLLEDVPEIHMMRPPFGDSAFFADMVAGCPNLTNTSVDNILKAIANSGTDEGAKTLKQLGFTEDIYPVSRLQQLNYFQDVLDAGWTTGY